MRSLPQCFTFFYFLSDNANKKPVRPLSANRRTPDKVWTDPDNEASAVMAALKAENEQASKLKQVFICFNVLF